VSCPPVSIGNRSFNVIAQTEHGETHRLGRLLGQPAPRILGADKSVHEAYQLRIIGFGKAEHVRNRSHRVRHRNIGRKIADAGAVGDGVHRDLRPVTQPFFQGQERGRGGLPLTCRRAKSMASLDR
jgi:hypothetical protein